jgi:GNAT superfamily N-acetyltransferase
MTDADLDQVNQVADAIHPTLPEREEVFADKFRAFPDGCYVFTLHNRVVGYAVSHPWGLYQIPALDTFLGPLPPQPECLFIHDVAILPEGRGLGGAREFVEIAVSLAQGLGIFSLALVSVYNTRLFWSQFGFEVVQRAELDKKLQDYGAADYMLRKL